IGTSLRNEDAPMCVESQILLCDPPDSPTKDIMEFHLVYAGNLLKSSKPGNLRVWEKHQIRRYLHPQMKKLWETHPLLQFYDWDSHMDTAGAIRTSVPHTNTRPEIIGQHFEGYVPLVLKDWGMVCDLDILFLRAEPAGNILQRGGRGGGDIDNRIKTLF